MVLVIKSYFYMAVILLVSEWQIVTGTWDPSIFFFVKNK